MVNRTPMACAIVATIWFASTSVGAHHSFGAEYDVKQPVTLTGVVTQIDWRNPHTFFFVDVTDKDGKVANWRLQGYAPSVLARIGWKKDVTMKPGDRITVTGWRARDGSSRAHSRDITLASGTKLISGPPGDTGDGGNASAVDVK